MSRIRAWPSLREEDRWLTTAMEQRLSDSTMSPRDLRARASELRLQAEASDIDGVRNAAMALADRYEQEAAARAATS